MKVYRNIDEFTPSGKSVVTIGTFDGVHSGHRKVISRLKETAERIKGETVILTFNPHPRMVLFPDSMQVLLTTDEEKSELIAAHGIDHLIIHPFTREFSMLSSEDFVSHILVEALGTKNLIIGFDHQFGKDRSGSFRTLEALAPASGFKVQEISVEESDHIKISSTRIRQALNAGDVDLANDLLGYRYKVSGTVVMGKQIGRTIGFPTANILPSDQSKLIPADGVYAVLVKVNGVKHKGMLNIGVRPTVDGTNTTVEVHIFNFDSDIYGESIEVEFAAWIRGEVRFSGLEALKKQLTGDKLIAESILNKL